MRLPEDFETKGKICKLRKALYGLKQAPQQWFRRLTVFLKSEGLIQLKTDQCVFKSTNSKLFVGIHVDDGLVVGIKSEMLKLMNKMKKIFETKVNENPDIYLDVEIKRSAEGIHIHQGKYVDHVINLYNMEASRSTTTPIAQQDNNNLKPVKTVFPYQEAIGSLLYLSCKTRPDICYAVNYASRFCKQPMQQDVVNIKRTIRYLKGTKEEGIMYSNKGEKHTLYVYCDSDHGGDRVDSKSTSGFMIYYGNGPIAWCSKKQSCVAQHSTEAEYIAAAQCCQQMKHVKSILEEMLYTKIDVKLFVDNTSCIKMIKANQLTRKCIYINVKYHLVKDEFNKGWFKINYCSTKENIADVLTKPLLPAQFQVLKTKFMTK